ncbi:hypothetical protein EJK15_05930 [Nonomuraea basaltis]|nr:hypothetical protein EJK15_05930 [Nonomuraea basaltis]
MVVPHRRRARHSQPAHPCDLPELLRAAEELGPAGGNAVRPPVPRPAPAAPPPVTTREVKEEIERLAREIRGRVHVAHSSVV